MNQGSFSTRLKNLDSSTQDSNTCVKMKTTQLLPKWTKPLTDGRNTSVQS